MATITEDFVSFETAKLLKEKGFDEPTLAYTYGRDMVAYYSQPRVTDNYNVEAGRYPLPTLQMAMKWLREVHKCYITFTWEFKEYDKKYKPVFKDIIWSFNISIPKYNSARQGDGSYFDLDSDKEFDSYEEVCEAAIKYCLKNLI